MNNSESLAADIGLARLVAILLDAPGITLYADVFPRLDLEHLRYLADERRTPRPRLRDGDRRFWILACRWVPRWRESLLVVQPATVLGWHRRGWTAY